MAWAQIINFKYLIQLNYERNKNIKKNAYPIFYDCIIIWKISWTIIMREIPIDINVFK